MSLRDQHDESIQAAKNPNDPETIYDKCAYCSHGWVIYRGASIPCNCELGDYWLNNASLDWRGTKYNPGQYEQLRLCAKAAKHRMDHENQEAGKLAREWVNSNPHMTLWEMVQLVSARMDVSQ